MTQMKRLDALDSIRGISVLLVIYSHTIQLLRGRYLPGSLGVTVFFFISGFIITRLLLTEDRIDLKSFYLRRCFRLLPALLVFMAVSSLLVGLSGYSIPIADDAAVLLYYANYHSIAPHDFAVYGTDAVKSPYTVTWSLSVEEQFYMFFPLLLIACRQNLKRACAFLFAFVIAVFIWRAYLVCGIGHLAQYRIEMGSDTRMDSIVYGCILSLLFHRARESGRLRSVIDCLQGVRGVLVGAILMGTALLCRGPDASDVLAHSIQGVALMSLFIGLFWINPEPSLSRFLRNRVLVMVGAMSYSLYLYHYLAFSMARLWLSNPKEQFVATWVFGFAAAWLSYHWIEGPGKRLGSYVIAQTRKADLVVSRETA
jgi:peptidoglycan/LPS O-acetylase OafA/YrhL